MYVCVYMYYFMYLLCMYACINSCIYYVCMYVCMYTDATLHAIHCYEHKGTHRRQTSTVYVHTCIQ